MTQHPDDAVRRLQDAAVSGLPVMLPGTLEPRQGAAPIEPVVPKGPFGPHTTPADPGDLERMGRELEAGGAPWERRLGRPATIVEGLRRSLKGLFGGRR